MTNLDYQERYLPYYQGHCFRFNPKATMHPLDYDYVVYAVATRTLCPRLPRMGEVVWVRSYDEAFRPWGESLWRRYVVEAVDVIRGVEVMVTLEGGKTLCRDGYNQTWRFDEACGPREMLS